MTSAAMLLLGLLTVLGCGRKPSSHSGAVSAPLPWLADVTDEVGLDFVHDAGPEDYFLPRLTGAGAALFDFDGDGRLDIYLLNSGGPKGQTNRLYRQTPDGRFVDVSKGSGLDFAAHCTGVAIGDVNNDGWPDVLVTEYRGARLFLNNGDGTFRNATEEAGLHNPLWGTSAAFVDYDRDGWLDLVIVNYLDYDPTWPCKSNTSAQDFCHPGAFNGTASRLFRNLGKAGKAPALEGGRRQAPPVRFRDVSFEAGPGRKAGPGLGVVCADFDGDGWPDIFIANDGKANSLWMNRPNLDRESSSITPRAFVEEAVVRGVAVNAMGRAEANMGIAWGDLDGDGLEDVFVTHLTHETNTFWKQGPRGLFRDKTVSSGLHHPAWHGTGFGVVLGDFDRDGALDLALANGRVSRGPAQTVPGLSAFWSPYAERHQLFANDGKGRFRDLSPANPAFCGRPGVGRGLALGDIENKGSLGLLVTEVAGRARLYRNVAPERGHWLVVRALTGEAKRDALGAEVRVRAGERTWVRTLQAAGSYQCSQDPRAHFGLGPAARFDAIEVTWPGGRRESFPGGTANRRLVLAEGAGQPQR